MIKIHQLLKDNRFEQLLIPTRYVIYLFIIQTNCLGEITTRVNKN